MASPTANLGGSYPSALETIRGVASARTAVAALFNCDPDEVETSSQKYFLNSKNIYVRAGSVRRQHDEPDHGAGAGGGAGEARPRHQHRSDQPRPRRQRDALDHGGGGDGGRGQPKI